MVTAALCVFYLNCKNNFALGKSWLFCVPSFYSLYSTYYILYNILYYSYIIYIFTVFISQILRLGEKEHGLLFMAEGLRLRDAGIFSRTAAEPTFWDTGDCCSSIIPGVGKLACGPLQLKMVLTF